MASGFDPAERLRAHVAGLVGRQLGNADLIEIMRLLRLVLEKEKLRGSYPTVALYCDWLLHTEIDRHEIAIDILEKMHLAIAAWDKTHDTAAISNAMDLAKLRAEMTVIFASKQVATDIVDSFSNWRTFVGALLLDLRDRPLKMPVKPRGKTKKRVDDAIAAMTAASKGQGSDHWTRAFFIVADDDGSLCWTLECETKRLVGASHINFKGKLGLTEPQNTFARP